MSALRSGTFRPGLMIATALAVLALPAVAQAYSQEQEQACTPDAMRLCGAYIPDVDRITVCMVQQKSRLSPACRAHFRPEPSRAAPAAAGRPLGITPAKARKPVSTKPKRPTTKLKKPKAT